MIHKSIADHLKEHDDIFIPLSCEICFRYLVLAKHYGWRVTHPITTSVSSK